MKKILAMAAVAALAAGASVYAANPFSDVSTSDWAYQAVSDLSSQGVVEGYPDGTFKGENNITRYEMAQIIARLMAKEDQLNAEQRATVDKLAGEYADELDNLGVRVSNLEKKVGNISWSGDARLKVHDYGDNADDQYKTRLRINVKGQVNDTVTVLGRFKSEADLKAGSDAGTTMDRLHVVWTPSDAFKLDLGKTQADLGETIVYYDDTFDGAIADYKKGNFGLELAYGRLYKGTGLKNYYTLGKDADGNKIFTDDSYESWYAQGKADFGAVDLTAFYLDYVKSPVSLTDDDVNIWGVGAGIQLADNLRVTGDYITNTAKVTFADGVTKDSPVLWNAGLTYGKEDLKKPGTWQLDARYVSAERGSYVGSTTFDMTSFLDYSWNKDSKFWQFKANIAAAKNVDAELFYYLADDVTNNDGKDADDIYGLEINYKF